MGVLGRGLGLVAAVVALAGCSIVEDATRRYNGRWGPDPVISDAHVQDVAKRQNMVLTYIIKEGLLTDPSYLETDDARWGEVALWGFNIGREDCASYLGLIHRFQHERMRNHNLLTAAQLAANGILVATSPGSKAISIVGQIFGLTIVGNDSVLDSYLLAEAPGLVSKKVKELQDAYQNDTDLKKINSSAKAYNAIQNYYNICLPPSIEGAFLEKIADSKALPTTDDKVDKKDKENKPATTDQTTPSEQTAKTPSLQ